MLVLRVVIGKILTPAYFVRTGSVFNVEIVKGFPSCQAEEFESLARYIRCLTGISIPELISKESEVLIQQNLA